MNPDFEARLSIMLGGRLFVKAGVLTRLNYFGKRSARCFRFDILYQLRTLQADSSAIDTSITYQSTLRTNDTNAILLYLDSTVIYRKLLRDS